MESDDRQLALMAFSESVLSLTTLEMFMAVMVDHKRIKKRQVEETFARVHAFVVSEPFPPSHEPARAFMLERLATMASRLDLKHKMN